MDTRSGNLNWPVGLEFCIIDFETTGLFPQFGHRIVEYAYLVVKEGQIIDRGEGLVNPNRPMSPDATNANGITDEMLRDKPRFDQIGGNLWHAITNRVLVAHNARFDLDFLAHECKRVGWNQPEFKAIDSLRLSRSLFTGQSNNKLETLANMASHDWSGDAHRAMADVEALFSIMNYIFSQFPNKLNSLNSLLTLGGIAKTTTDSPSINNMSKEAQTLIQNKGKIIEINYNSKSSGISLRKITPSDVFVNNNMEYVDAYCHYRLTNRTFRVDRISGLFPDDIKVESFTYPDGSRYEGEFKDDWSHGQGVLTYPDGRRYEGEFKDGFVCGQGVETFPDGRRYEGEFKDGKRHGQGVLTYPDGRRYEGEFKDGFVCGFGVETFSDGGRYEGAWKDGWMNGKGIYIWSDGSRYEGEFKDSKRHGQGEFTNSNGIQYEGEWKDDLPAGKISVRIRDELFNVGE